MTATPSPQSAVVPVEARECARLLVQELTPDQGQSAGRAFGLAVSLQAMLVAALSPEAPAGEGGVSLDALADWLVMRERQSTDGALQHIKKAPAKHFCAGKASAFREVASVLWNSPEWFALTPRHEAPARDELPEDDELPGDFLARVGMDGALWATEFRKMALKLGYSDMNEGWLIGWFCNAVMAGYDHAERKFDPALTPRHEAPAEGAGELIKTIRTRLIGVSPDDQDVVLEDSDWLMIVAALGAAK